jgi:hypothetical protein
MLFRSQPRPSRKPYSTGRLQDRGSAMTCAELRGIRRGFSRLSSIAASA